MAKFKYDGEGEVTLPTLGLVVNQGDVIEASEDFVATGFSLVSDDDARTETKAEKKAREAEEARILEELNSVSPDETSNDNSEKG